MSTLHGLLDIRCVGCGSWGAQCCGSCLTTALGSPRQDTVGGVTVFALGDYRGPLRDIVRAIKFRGVRALLGQLGPTLESLGRRFPGAVALPIPASRAGFVSRGFHLTRRVAHLMGLSTSTALTLDDRGSQRHRRRTERLRGRTMHIPPRSLSARTRVVLVDDVMTTGATLRAAIEACHLAGLVVVGAIVLATTPPTVTRRVPLPNTSARV